MKKLSEKQKAQIDAAFDYADAEDKSTEFALQFAADSANCEIEDVIEYLVAKE